MPCFSATAYYFGNFQLEHPVHLKNYNHANNNKTAMTTTTGNSVKLQFSWFFPSKEITFSVTPH